MEIIDLNQNSEDWLESRKAFIGGSDVAAVMNISPYKTRFQLWEEKLGLREFKGNEYIFQKGHALEDRARTIYELTYNIDVPPKVIRHKDYSFAQVSLDGFNLEMKKAVEFKYVGEKVFDRVLEEEFIPDHYVCQVQYQLFVTGFRDMDFVAYSEKRDSIATIKVLPDMEYIARMVAMCQEFTWEVENQIPPRLVDKDYKKVQKATLRRTIESLKKALKETYPEQKYFLWDGVYLEIKDV